MSIVKIYQPKISTDVAPSGAQSKYLLNAIPECPNRIFIFQRFKHLTHKTMSSSPANKILGADYGDTNNIPDLNYSGNLNEHLFFLFIAEWGDERDFYPALNNKWKVFNEKLRSLNTSNDKYASNGHPNEVIGSDKKAYQAIQWLAWWGVKSGTGLDDIFKVPSGKKGMLLLGVIIGLGKNDYGFNALIKKADNNNHSVVDAIRRELSYKGLNHHWKTGVYAPMPIGRFWNYTKEYVCETLPNKSQSCCPDPANKIEIVKMATDPGTTDENPYPDRNGFSNVEFNPDKDIYIYFKPYKFTDMIQSTGSGECGWSATPRGDCEDNLLPATYTLYVNGNSTHATINTTTDDNGNTLYYFKYPAQKIQKIIRIRVRGLADLWHGKYSDEITVHLTYDVVNPEWQCLTDTDTKCNTGTERDYSEAHRPDTYAGGPKQACPIPIWECDPDNPGYMKDTSNAKCSYKKPAPSGQCEPPGDGNNDGNNNGGNDNYNAGWPSFDLTKYKPVLIAGGGLLGTALIVAAGLKLLGGKK